MRNLREMGKSRRIEGGLEQDLKFPSALLAAAGLDDKIFMWYPETGDIYKEYLLDRKVDAQVNSLKFSLDGRLLAVTGYEVLRVYDVHSNSPITNMSYNSESNSISKNITCVSFVENDATSLVTGGEDGFCRLWEFPQRNLKLTREINCSDYGVINCLSSKHPFFGAVIGTQLGYILGCRWDPSHPEPRIVELFHKKALGIQSVDCRGDNASNVRIVAMTNTGYLLSYYKDRWTTTKVHDKFGLCSVMSNNGEYLATGGSDAKIRLYGLEDQKMFELHTFFDSKLKWIWNLQFSFDNQFLFVAASDGIVQMWSLKDKQVKRFYRGHAKSVVSLSLFEGRQQDQQQPSKTLSLNNL